MDTLPFRILWPQARREIDAVSVDESEEEEFADIFSAYPAGGIKSKKLILRKRPLCRCRRDGEVGDSVRDDVKVRTEMPAALRKSWSR